MRDLAEVFQHHGHEGERGGAEDAEDGIYGGVSPGRRGPDKDQVADCRDGNEDFDGEKVFLAPVDNGACDGCSNETGDNEYGARDSGFGFGEAVGKEYLVYDGGDGVKEADVDEEGDENHIEFRKRHKILYRGEEGIFQGR